MTETCTVVQRVKLLFVTTASHTRVLIQVLPSLLAIQLPTDVPGKSVEDSPSTCTLATHVVDLVASLAPGFIWPSPGFCGHLWSEPGIGSVSLSL